MEQPDPEHVWNEAIAMLETGRFWDAHEVLEGHWLKADGTERAMAAGVILLCAALHKALVMGSDRGGRRNYAKALKHLALVPDHYGGADVRELEARVHAALHRTRTAPRWPYLQPEEAT